MEEDKQLSLAYGYSLRLLARREYSEQELRQKLYTKYPDKNIVDEVISKLLEKNYLSNERYSEMIVRHYIGANCGPQKIRLELMKKGVDPDKQESFLNLSDQDYIQAAKEIALKKYGDITVLDYKTKQKVMSFLYRKGFTIEQCHAVFNNDFED